jgi:hypothetical protein
MYDDYILLDVCGTPCEIIPSSKCSRDYPRNVQWNILDACGTPCEIIPSSKCSRDYPRNVRWYILDVCGTPCEIIPSNRMLERLSKECTMIILDDMTWYDLKTRLLNDDCWYMCDCEICGWSKVVDCAGRICRRSELWWVTTFKSLTSALLIYIF